jgi:hypothetical protein
MLLAPGAKSTGMDTSAVEAERMPSRRKVGRNCRRRREQFGAVATELCTHAWL